MSTTLFLLTLRTCPISTRRGYIGGYSLFRPGGKINKYASDLKESTAHSMSGLMIPKWDIARAAEMRANLISATSWTFQRTQTLLPFVCMSFVTDLISNARTSGSSPVSLEMSTSLHSNKMQLPTLKPRQPSTIYSPRLSSTSRLRLRASQIIRSSRNYMILMAISCSRTPLTLIMIIKLMSQDKI